MSVVRNQAETFAPTLGSSPRAERDRTEWSVLDAGDARERAVLGQQLNLWTIEQAVHIRFADAFAISMPLALAAATFVAHGFTAKSLLCTWLGVASFLAVIGVQWRARSVARQELLAAAKQLGVSDSFANKWARDLLRSWMG